LIDPAMAADEMTAHLPDDDRQSQPEPHPEAAGHVGQFGVGLGVQGDQVGLQRHSADRAATGSRLADLRMHGAGVDRALRDGRFHRSLGFAEVLLWSSRELGLAAGRAEKVSFALIIEVVLAGFRIDRHSTDRVPNPRVRIRMIMVDMVTMGARMTMLTTMIRRVRPSAAAA